MKKLLLCVSLVMWGVISCQAGPKPEVGTTVRALSAPLPPVNDYSTRTTLPSGGYTHLVVALCSGPDLGNFSAAFVDASSGAVVSLLRGRDPTLTSRFLSSAYGLGVPVTVYTAPVIVLSEDQPPSSGPGGEPLPINGVLFPTCTPNGDTSDPPPEGDPTGDEEANWWELFGSLSLKTAQALHQVSRAPPPPARR